MNDSIREQVEEFIRETNEAEFVEVDGEEAVRFLSPDSAGETIPPQHLRYSATLGFYDARLFGEEA